MQACSGESELLRARAPTRSRQVELQVPATMAFDSAFWLGCQAPHNLVAGLEVAEAVADMACRIRRLGADRRTMSHREGRHITVGSSTGARRKKKEERG